MLFGAQVKQAGGLLVALRRAEAMRAEVMQVFPQSPRQWRYPGANAERSVAFGEVWPVSRVVRRVVCHAPYPVNLGICLDTQSAWTGWHASTSTTPRSPGARASTVTTTWAGD